MEYETVFDKPRSGEDPMVEFLVAHFLIAESLNVSWSYYDSCVVIDVDSLQEEAIEGAIFYVVLARPVESEVPIVLGVCHGSPG